MSNVPSFLALLQQSGSDVIYHRDDSSTPCPCRTPEGYRDPIWHLQHSSDPICNEAGFLTDGGAIQYQLKAFVQPIQSTRATRLRSEQLLVLFGEIQEDDHLGIFPCEWGGITLDFNDWSTSGEDWIEYVNRRFMVVNTNLIPDPADGNPFHHWEIGLRLMNKDPL